MLDDDGTGEVADIVALRDDDDRLHVMLVHCKYSSEDNAGRPRRRSLRRMRPSAEVDPLEALRRDVRSPHPAREQLRARRTGVSGFVAGGGNDLYSLRDRAYQLTPRFGITIAQPGLSKTAASTDQLRLLSATDVYVSAVAVAELHVWCSA